MVKAFTNDFARAPSDCGDADREDDADGNCVVLVLVPVHPVAPGAGGVRNVFPVLVVLAGGVSFNNSCANCCMVGGVAAAGDGALGGVPGGVAAGAATG